MLFAPETFAVEQRQQQQQQQKLDPRLVVFILFMIKKTQIPGKNTSTEVLRL